MINRTRRMKQIATYWAPAPADLYGNTSFAAPVLVMVRWQAQAVLFVNSEGREETSSAVVYPAMPLAIQGYIFLGTSVASNPKTVAGAYEIRQLGGSPNLRQTETLAKVFL